MFDDFANKLIGDGSISDRSTREYQRLLISFLLSARIDMASWYLWITQVLTSQDHTGSRSGQTRFYEQPAIRQHFRNFRSTEGDCQRYLKRAAVENRVKKKYAHVPNRFDRIEVDEDGNVVLSPKR